MIKLQDLTPAIYYTKSRDFQFIGRLYDIVLNSVKTNAANLYNLPVGKNMDEQLLNLLAFTLGFKPTKQYNSKQLLAICESLPSILRNKGNLQALVLAVNALLAAEGIKQPLDYSITPKKNITLYVAQELKDLTLLTDLLDYLLPAGLDCVIIKETQVYNTSETLVAVRSYVTVTQPSEDGKTIVGIDSDTMSQIADKTNSEQLLLGAIGTRPSVIQNTTIKKKAIPLAEESMGGENDD